MTEVDELLDIAVAALGGDERVGQHHMANAVAATIDGGGHLLVQAGTGTGKSLAYLVPALAHATTGENGKVVIATATLALQRQLVDRDVPNVVAALAGHLERTPQVAVLKGRQNYICLQKLHGGDVDEDQDELFETARTALGEQAVAVRSWAETSETGDRDEYPGEIDPRVWRGLSVSRRECVGESKCAFGEECFTAKRRELVNEADVVVTNHAMLAIDALEGIPVLPEYDAVVIDEGHELVDRATTAMTAELNVRMIEQARTRARKLLTSECVELLDDAIASLEGAFTDLAVDGPTRYVELPKSLVLSLALVRDASHTAIAQLNTEKPSDPDAVASLARAKGAMDEVHDVAGRMLALATHDVLWLDGSELRAPTLRLAPMSVGAALQGGLFERTPVVVTSATLTVGGAFDQVAGALGLAGSSNWVGLDVGSPFEYAKQGILYVAAALPPPGRDGVSMEALDELAELIEAAGGRTLALFSSWKSVERAAEYLKVRLAEQRLLVQMKGDAVGPLVEKFASDERSTLLGTLTLWQGVDVPGAACHLVAIDRIPFPRPDDPLTMARQQAVDDAGGSGFRAVSVPKAGLMLAQGVGRLIRGPADRGVVAVLDSRLATAGYGRSLRASLPPFWYTTDKDVVKSSLARLDAEASP